MRQASSYGVGIMAQCGGEPYADAIRQSLPLLVQVINDPSSRDQANINSTENCIAAVTKVTLLPLGRIMEHLVVVISSCCSHILLL